MSHTPHELADEFPEDQVVLHALKLNNAHYNTMAQRYREVNDELHRIEAGIETPSDEHTETLKKKRLALLDEIATMVAGAKTGA